MALTEEEWVIELSKYGLSYYDEEANHPHLLQEAQSVPQVEQI